MTASLPLAALQTAAWRFDPTGLGARRRAVLRGAAGARAAADRLVARLQSQLDVAVREKKEVEAAYAALLGDHEVAARVRCMLPALMAAVAGVEVSQGVGTGVDPDRTLRFLNGDHMSLPPPSWLIIF